MNRFPTLLLAATLAAGPAVAADAPARSPAKNPAATADSSLKTDQDKTLYVLGAMMGQKLGAFRLTEGELDIIRKGMTDQVMGRPLKAEPATYGPKLDELAKGRAKAFAAEVKTREKPFLAKAAAAKGAVRKPSGLIYTELKAGSGASPKATDKVKVRYQGTLSDGTVFDSSLQRKEPTTVALNQVLPCWVEGVQMMKVGGKAKLVCPSELAYGDAGMLPKIKPGATLVFDVELTEIAK